MAFAVFVEMLNLKIRGQKPKPRRLHSRRLRKAIERVEQR
jgi:hypothetical protein